MFQTRAVPDLLFFLVFSVHLSMFYYNFQWLDYNPGPVVCSVESDHSNNCIILTFWNALSTYETRSFRTFLEEIYISP